MRRRLARDMFEQCRSWTQAAGKLRVRNRCQLPENHTGKHLGVCGQEWPKKRKVRALLSLEGDKTGVAASPEANKP